MAYLPLPPSHRISQLLSYDADTGDICWKPVAPGVIKGKPCHTPEGAANGHNSKFAGKIAGHPDETGRRRICIDGSLYYAHRLAWFIHMRREPIGVIDHINGNPSDNRICNLRDVEYVHNSRNKVVPVISQSGHRGVYPRGDKFRAIVREQGRNISLGTFEKLDDAIAARNAHDLRSGFSARHITGNGNASID